MTGCFSRNVVLFPCSSWKPAKSALSDHGTQRGGTDGPGTLGTVPKAWVLGSGDPSGLGAMGPRTKLGKARAWTGRDSTMFGILQVWPLCRFLCVQHCPEVMILGHLVLSPVPPITPISWGPVGLEEMCPAPFKLTGRQTEFLQSLSDCTLETEDTVGSPGFAEPLPSVSPSALSGALGLPPFLPMLSSRLS